MSRVHVFVWAEGGNQRGGWATDVEFKKKKKEKRVALASHLASASSAVTGWTTSNTTSLQHSDWLIFM